MVLLCFWYSGHPLQTIGFMMLLCNIRLSSGSTCTDLESQLPCLLQV